MTYNVRYFAHAMKGLCSTQRGMRLIAEGLAGLPELPHVVGLQEVETRSMRASPSHERGGRTQLETFMSRLDTALAAANRSERYVGYYFPAHEYRLGAAKFYTTGLAVLVLDGFQLDETHPAVPHDITHRKYRLTAKVKQTRICAHVRVHDEAGQSFDVFNTHLSLPALFSTPRTGGKGRMGYGPNQLEEVEALTRFISERASSDRFVVMGDFNALPGSPVYTRMLEQLEVRDTFAEHVELDTDTLRKDWPTCGFAHLRMRLDHLFAGPGLEVAGMEHTHAFGDRAGRWHGLSDHVPIVAQLAVR